MADTARGRGWRLGSLDHWPDHYLTDLPGPDGPTVERAALWPDPTRPEANYRELSDRPA